MSASKRDILVRNAMKVLYKEGFNCTGMDRLAEKTGVSKMTMYKHFKTKDDLIVAALKLRDEEFISNFTRRVEEISSDPRERLVAVFDAMIEWIEGRDFFNCMFIKAAAEFQDPKHPIHKEAALHKQKVLDFIHNLAVAAGARNPELLARQLFILTEGEIVAAAILGDRSAARDAKSAGEILIAAACP